MFLGDGRKAFLEFLRNLTPQILFLTLSLVVGSKLDLSKFQIDASGFGNALPFAVCLLIFFGAAIANMSMFIESALTSTERLKTETEAIEKKGLKGLVLIWALLCTAWKHNKLAFFQLALSLLIIEFAFVAVFVVSIHGALASPFLKK